MNHFRVIIVGAGAAGIAAASHLLDNGVYNLAILEAENRIGGRICTTHFGDNIIEIGAQWVHGEKNNIVYDMASKYDLVTGSENNFEKSSFFDSSGTQINRDVCNELGVMYWEIMESADHDLKNYAGSFGEYFTSEYYKKIEELNKRISVSPRLADQFLHWFEQFENSIDGSDSWFQTSGKGHLEYWDCEGDLLNIWKSEGYKTLLDILTKKYPNPKDELPVKNKTILNKEVTKIRWNEELKAATPDVVIECQDGTFYTADHVIVTFSIGVMKEKATQIFIPSLPQQKLDSIQGIGFGTVDKLFLRFSHPWWTDDNNGFSFLWTEEDKKADTSGWLSEVIGFHPDNYEPNVLLGWVTGPAAHVMEKLSENEVMEGCMSLLYRFLGGKYQVPRAVAFQRSTWYVNPHFRGSYSCRLMKSDQMNVWASQLAKPVVNRRGSPVLLFAGEATHDHYFSTVHGAVESGKREAERLLPLLLTGNGIKNHYQVLIVGAGISGLAAAKTFIENGIMDVVVLEAQATPGGRIQSTTFEKEYFELGAQWIHGDKNEVFQICQNNRMLSDVHSQEGEGLYLREDGSIVDNDIVKEVDDLIKDILENCEDYALSDASDNIPDSIGKELRAKFNEYLNDCTSDTEEMKIIKKELFDWHVRFQVIDNSCSDLNKLSAKAWGLYRFCGGSDYVNFNNGYISLVNYLVTHLPENIFRFSTPVRHVEWTEHYRTAGSSNCGVKVICDSDLQFTSDYVIITSSLGYLKERHRMMFNPPLPCHLSQAIDTMGFGVIDKIFLIYDEPWWDPDVKGFQLLWSDSSSEGHQWHWATDVTGFDVILSKKPVLLGWVGGEGAKVVEKLSDEDLAGASTEILRKFTRNSEIPLPKKVLRSKWWSNEFVKGGYSHTTVECDRLGIIGSDLARPVMSTVCNAGGDFKKPTILLAGEATHETFFSTVHGAFESGQNQAQVVLNNIRLGQKL